jgi:hypothetical protein
MCLEDVHVLTYLWAILKYLKSKGKGHPRTGHEGPEGEYSSFNLDARWGWVVSATLRPLYPRERPVTHCMVGWVGPRAGVNRCGKSRRRRDSIPGSSSP